ncbi:Xyloglucan galactosyltransferase XLT2 [Linum grandiflorum]
MLPLAEPPPPKKPKIDDDKIGRKNSFSSLTSLLKHAHLSHPRSWLLISVLLIQILLLLSLRSLPFPFPFHRHVDSVSSPSPLPAAAVSVPVVNSIPPAAVSAPIVNPISADCENGYVYVYDLPSNLNYDLIHNCEKLNPWSSRCDALANDGFGQQATAGVAGIVPEELAPAWYWTDQFVSEIVYHNRMMKHRCRTTNPANATAFYIPFYAGLAVGRFLWQSFSAKDRDLHCEQMLTWIQDQDYFKRSNGWDHFLTMGRITWDFRRSEQNDWGSRCIYLPGMRNITRLLIERNPWDYFDVGVPYPTGFHPRSDSDVVLWQEFVRRRNRSTLFSFAGASRKSFKNDFREILINHCINESDACRVVNCGATKCANGSAAILETFLDSDFCLQPRGDSFTRRSIFDCMIAGSIPVVFWRRTAYYQYEWFLPGEATSYSVFIHRNDVKNGTSIRKVLDGYSREEVRKMREKVIEYIPKLVYARSSDGLETIKDAFDVAIDGVLRRFEEQKEFGYKW